MKTGKEFLRDNERESTRKVAKLDPIRRSGKERHNLYKSLDKPLDEDDNLPPVKRESALDYLDNDEL